MLTFALTTKQAFAGVDPPGEMPRSVRGLRSRMGLTMIELIAAATILAVLLASTVQVIRVLDSQQRNVARRTLALEIAQALLEELGNTRWEELAPAVGTEWTIPEALTQSLPGATASATIVEEQDPVVAKRVTIEIEWPTASGVSAAPTRLTTWVYPDE